MSRLFLLAKVIYPNRKANEPITNHIHVQENSVQAYTVSDECITVPLDDNEVVEEGGKADTCGIKIIFKDQIYAKYNEKDHLVLAVFVTTSRHSLQNLVAYIEFPKLPIRAALRYAFNFTKYIRTYQNSLQSSHRSQASLSVR